MNIIAKKVRGFFSNNSGLIRPLFELTGTGEHRVIQENEYLNNGCVFISDYELLNTDISSDVFLIENCFFISDDNLYGDKQAEPNACQKRINYNSRISNFFSSLPPTKFVPIYENEFDLNSARVKSPENITVEFFFLRNLIENRIYGPFQRDNFDLKAANFHTFEHDYDNEIYRDFLDDYSEFDGAVVFSFLLSEVENLLAKDIQQNAYVIDFTTLFKSKLGEAIELTPFPLLHQWAINKIANTSKELADSIDNVKNLDLTFSSSIDDMRWQRYKKILDKVKESKINIDKLINVILEKGFFDDIGETDEVASLKKQVDEFNVDINLKNEEIIRLKDERKEIEISLQTLSEKQQKIVDSVLYPNLSNLLQENDKLQEIELIIENNKNHESLSDEIKNLQIRKQVLSEDIKKLEEDERKVAASVRLIKQNFDSDVEVHTSKLADAKMYSDLLNGINFNLFDKDVPQAIESFEVEHLPTELNTARNYINEIQRRLRGYGRDLSFNEVANLIITINQSFLTIIAGAPGVGKTSIVEKLSKSYGLNSGFGYLEINCARGWTSSKDILGFYNPLTGTYQQSKTKLKDALEKSSRILNAPYLVLLDEANLSPIEHYWSDFIKLSDNEYDRVVRISEKELISFGEGFRFIATINYDHTTEALSNRLLDRSPIIQLERTNLVTENKGSLETIDFMYDFHEVQKLFNDTAKWKSDEALIKSFLNSLKEKIESANIGILISPRKELAIRRYCKAATGLLEGNSYTALDYAVAQHILPLINGRGETFESILKSIKNDLNDKGMLKSEKLVSKILDKGKDFKHFKYSFY